MPLTHPGSSHGADPAAAGPVEVVVVLVADRRVAFRLSGVEEVQRVVRIMPLPGAQGLVEGVVDRRGEVVPVFDARRRFGCLPRPVQLSDKLVFLRTPIRVVALRVDAVVGVSEAELAPVEPPLEEVSAALDGAGVARCADGLLVVHDTDRFLSPGEAAVLDAALEALDRATP